MTVWVAVMVAITARPLVGRILQSMAKKGLRRLILAVRVYAAVISLTLFSALMTIFRSDWLPGSAYLASAGAILLVVSDMLLGWNKFVKPVRRGRLLLMITYHLGQFALITGVVGQFS
jgi:uncharacterized membrane protein YhhN